MESRENSRGRETARGKNDDAVQNFASFSQLLNPAISSMSGRAKIVVDGTTLEVNSNSLLRGCRLFAENPILVRTPSAIRSPASLPVVQDFIGFVEGRAVIITPHNASGLWLLSEEFGFDCLLKEFSKLGKGIDSESRERFLSRSFCLIRDRSRNQRFRNGRTELPILLWTLIRLCRV